MPPELYNPGTALALFDDMPKTRSLEKYRRKRKFDVTSEPRGGRRQRRKGEPIFVVQKHQASRLHYDFRLEIGGVLRSWAVPKGPSTNPKEKRLAVEVEDHPLEYAEFEGVIPADEYGAGTVQVWDRGTYRSMMKNRHGQRVPLEKAPRTDNLEFWLEGKKLRGGYALIHSKMRGRKENWLLIKLKDDAADARRNPVNTETKSVLTGRTLKQIAREESG